jgi:hypothetical protein
MLAGLRCILFVSGVSFICFPEKEKCENNTKRTKPQTRKTAAMIIKSLVFFFAVGLVIKFILEFFQVLS